MLAGLRRKSPVGMAAVTLLPAWAVLIFAYGATMLWTVQISFTDSKMLPANTWIGFTQYQRLFASARWLTALENLVIFGVLFVLGCLVIGFLLAVALDQKFRFENVLRTVFLYPYALSFIVTGVIWQWILNPELGVQKVVRGLGWESFTLDWLAQRNLAIYAIVLAGVWHSSGLVMTLMLAGLRQIDTELWHAARVDGVPAWRVYVFVVIPLLAPTIATSTLFLSIGVVKSFDLVVALTDGGPGIATDVPAKFIMDYLFGRQNIGLATAASTVMLLTVLLAITPWLYAQYFKKKSVGR